MTTPATRDELVSAVGLDAAQIARLNAAVAALTDRPVVISVGAHSYQCVNRQPQQVDVAREQLSSAPVVGGAEVPSVVHVAAGPLGQLAHFGQVLAQKVADLLDRRSGDLRNIAHKLAPSSLAGSEGSVGAVAGVSPSRGAGDRLVCTCGHAREAHEHHRAGSDCSLCTCARYEAKR